MFLFQSMHFLCFLSPSLLRSFIVAKIFLEHGFKILKQVRSLYIITFSISSQSLIKVFFQSIQNITI